MIGNPEASRQLVKNRHCTQNASAQGVLSEMA
jgi:hypothetical protein